MITLGAQVPDQPADAVMFRRAGGLVQEIMQKGRAAADVDVLVSTRNTVQFGGGADVESAYSMWPADGNRDPADHRKGRFGTADRLFQMRISRQNEGIDAQIGIFAQPFSYRRGIDALGHGAALGRVHQPAKDQIKASFLGLAEWVDQTIGMPQIQRQR